MATVLECKDTELAEFSMIYARPIGGKRTFRFKNAEDMAEHISQNQPGMFAGVPYLGEKYDEKMAQLASRGYRLPSDE